MNNYFFVYNIIEGKVEEDPTRFDSVRDHPIGTYVKYSSTHNESSPFGGPIEIYSSHKATFAGTWIKSAENYNKCLEMIRQGKGFEGTIEELLTDDLVKIVYDLLHAHQFEPVFMSNFIKAVKSGDIPDFELSES